MITVAIACVAAQACAAQESREKVGIDIERFTVARDDSVYECFPSLARMADGRIALTYRESDGHVPKEFCRLIVRFSDDDGKTFSAKQVLADVKRSDDRIMRHNCPKIQQLKDGRLLMSCDVFPYPTGGTGDYCAASHIMFWFSSDNGKSWAEPVDTGVRGIMPDEGLELPDGTWLLATQFLHPETREIMQYVSRSTDGGKTWGKPILVAYMKGYNLCEASILRVPDGTLVCYMRENSCKGYPVYKSLSTDGGLTWKGPYKTQMGCGLRPVAHLTKSGKVLITYRYHLGGAGPRAQNTFAYLESTQSAVEPDRQKQCGRLLSLDHDRNEKPDGGYTGWVETAPGQFFAVNYIKDDAPMAQIRGYRFTEQDF